MNVQLPVRGDPHEPVLAAHPGRVEGLPDGDAGHLRPPPHPAPRPPFVPAEALPALIERLAQVRAGDRTLIASVAGIAVGRVHPADVDGVDPQLGRRLVEERLHRAGDLVLARPALRPPRGRVGEHRDRAEAHGEGRVHDGNGARRAAVVAEPAVGTVFLHDEQVRRRDPAVIPEPQADASLEPCPRRPDRVFLRPADPHHDRAAGLPGHVRRDRHDRVGTALGAEPAPAELAHVDQVGHRNPDVAGQPAQHRALALAGSEDMALAILPVRHRRTGFHRVMRGAGGHEGLVEHQSGVAETGFEVPVGPLVVDFAHRQLALRRRGEVRFGPLDLLDPRTALRRVAVLARVGAAGAQALQRIQDEGQRLEVQLDLLDRVVRGRLVHRRERRDGLAHEVRRVGEDGVARRVDPGHVVGGEDGDHPLHGERFPSIDRAHPRVRHRTRDEAAEEHAVGAEVLRVPGSSGDLCDHIRRCEVFPDQIRHWTPPARRA